MNKYRGAVIVDSDFTYKSDPFNTIAEAEEWVKRNNNNLEFKSKIEELDNYGNVIDWYMFSE